MRLGIHARPRVHFGLLFVLLTIAMVIVAAPVRAFAVDDPPPVMGGQLFSTGGQLTVEVMPASAGYTSNLYLLDPEEVPIATNREVGKKVTLGPYGQGTELVFGIRVAGSEFRLGPGARNPDGLPHAVVDFGTDGCATVGFEDLFGGGDRDYDDNVFRFCGAIAGDDPGPEPPPTPDPVQPPVADAGPDQSVPEGSTVTLDGTGSRASTKPALQSSDQQGTLPGGTSLGTTITGLDPDSTHLRALGKVSIGEGPPVRNTSIAYVVDVSGSTAGGGGCGGNVNGDGSSNTILDCELAAALKLQEEVAAAGTVDKVALIKFGTTASAIDLDPTSGVATLVSPTADKDANGVPDVVQAIKQVTGSGGTNFLPPTQMACQMLATTGSPNLVTAFMSDGEGSGALKNVLPCTPPVTFHAFAVGANSHCASGSPVGSRLIDMATLSGGTCTDVPSVTSLPDILPQVVASRLTHVSYTIDGGTPVDLTAQLGLPLDGPDNADVAFDLPSDLSGGTHRICLTATGTDSGGESSETTCSDLVTVTGQVSYSWRVVSQQGPPIFLSSRTSAHPTFVVPDDGHYVLELTVTDGTGGTATDRVAVDVTNVAPHVSLTHGDSFAGGVTQVNGALTDAGWLDTHSATVDWGDGTTDHVDVTTGGAGWGTFFGSHVYRQAGSFDVVVTLTDDDGGQDTARVDHLEVATPVAVWANATGSRSLNWGGGSGEIQGRVHTNGELRFVGDRKSVVGPTTYAGSIAADTTKNSFVPLPVQAPVQDFPIKPQVADFRPGGPVATEVGSAYHDMSAQCSAGSWHSVQAVLPSGVYYASCDIALNGSDIGGRVTLVSEGHIKLAGSRPAFQPYRDGLLLLAGATGTKAIDISTSTSKFLGVLFAGSGEISVSGGTNSFYCGILGNTVSITGTDVTVRGASCGRPDRTVSGPVVVPDLSADLAVDHDTALPSDTLGYDVTVTNRGTTVVVPSLIGLENVDTVGATVTGYDFVVERQDAVTHEWSTFLAKGDPSMTVNLRSNPFPGVTYPASGVGGTTVPAGGWATWGLQAVLRLTPDQTTVLLDPARTSGVRTRVDFTLDPSSVQARRLYTFGSDFSARLRALGAAATDVDVTTILPDGDAQVSSVTAGTTLAPGASATLHRTWTVPVPAPRGTSETDAGYLGRLVALDGTQLNGAAYAVGKGGVGRLVVPLQHVATTRQLPVVGVSTVGSATIPAGTSGDYDVKLADLGSADASALQVAASADTSPLTVRGAPTALGAGELATAHTSYAAPTGSSGSVVLRSTASWKDARGNAYGAMGSDLAVARQVPAALSASLTAALQRDLGNDNVVSPGDTVRYTLVVRNGGGLPLQGVSGSVPAPANAQLVAGSASTPDGGSASVADGVVTFTLPDVAGSTSRRVVFDAVVADPFPDVARIQTQGSVSATGLDPVLTDDPALPGSSDPTRTTVTKPTPALTAALTGRLVVDADGNGVVSPGDTLAYSLGLSSVGTQQVTGIRITVPAPAGTTLVAGSVNASQGTVADGGDVDVAVGTLAPFQETTVGFRLKVASPLPTGVTAITTSGTVTSDQLDPIRTDDPQKVTVGDGTTIPIGGDGSNPEIPGATVSSLSPKDGDRVASPTPVAATVTAPAGTTIATWQVQVVPASGGDPVVLASGTGNGQASVDVTATLDPTTMTNGLYLLQVVTVTSDGGHSTSSTSVVVDGDFKPGRMTTSFLDHQVGIGGLPLQVTRSYDSFDTSVGDFGVGWRVGLADFRIARAIPLGATGWSAQSAGCGLIFCNLKYTSSVPHSVSVVWPDGHQEVFDMVGVDGSTFFPGIARATFVPHPGSGTTSTLKVAGDDSVFFRGDSAYAGPFGIDGVFDPSTFQLTDTNGTTYVIDRAQGLRTMTDRSGNSLTFTVDGVTSSFGKDITYTRDGSGRITRIVSPEGTTSYSYDHGDLVSSTDLAGVTTSYAYDGHHHLTEVRGAGGRSLGGAEYDAQGRMTAWVDANGNRTTVDTNVGAGQESVVDPEGRVRRTSTYDDAGDLVRVDVASEGVTHTTRYTYDSHHRVLTTTDPAGGTVSVTRDPDHGWVTSRTDQRGNVVKVSYNSLGRPTSFTDADGRVVETMDYNEFGDLVADRPADGPVVEMTYDSKGNVLTLARAGRVVQTFTYDGDGRPKTVTDAAGRTITATYDSAGRLVQQTGGRTGRVDITYDAVGHPLSHTDATGATRTWTWSPLGDMTSSTDELGHATTYTYDGAHHLLSRVDRNGDTTSYTYDRDGRPTQVTMPGRTIGYAYDGFGRAVRATAGSVTTDLGYDRRGLLVSTRTSGPGLPDLSFAYDHDATGALTATDGPGGRQTFGYDGSGRLTSVTDVAGGVFAMAYDRADRLTSMSRPNGVTDTLSYDAEGRLQSELQLLGGTRVTGASYGYDQIGRVTSVVDDAGTHTFGYDADSNLASADHPAGYSVPDETFTYDQLGNRTSDRLDPLGSMAYDRADRLTRDARADYAYDAEGNRVRRTDRATGAVTTYAWTPDHLLSSVTVSGATTTYRYDALGRRVQSTAPDGTVRTWAYDGQSVRAVLRGQGSASTLVRTFSTTPSGSPLSVRDESSGAMTYPVTDGTGSVTGALDAHGALVGVTQYGAFGDPHPVSGGTGEEYSFTGHAYDAGTGLVYARSRYYDPSSGQFLSEDPLGGANSYTYAANQPLDLVDPTGAAAVEYAGLVRTAPERVAAAIEASAEIETYGAEAAMNVTRGGLDAVLKGQGGVNEIVSFLEGEGYTVQQEVTMAAQNGLRTRLDILVQRGEERFFIEVKTGQFAKLTQNQRMLFPTLNDWGLIARGANAEAAGLTPGMSYIIPGFIVWI